LTGHFRIADQPDVTQCKRIYGLSGFPLVLRYTWGTMLLRSKLRRLLTGCLPAFGVLGLVIARSQSHLLGDIGKFILAALAASLLLFVIRRSFELAREAAQRKFVAAFLPMPR